MIEASTIHLADAHGTNACCARAPCIYACRNDACGADIRGALVRCDSNIRGDGNIRGATVRCTCKGVRCNIAQHADARTSTVPTSTAMTSTAMTSTALLSTVLTHHCPDAHSSDACYHALNANAYAVDT